MDVMKLVSRRQLIELQAMNQTETEPINDKPLTKSEQEQLGEKASAAIQRMNALIWHDERRLDGRVLPLTLWENVMMGHEPAKRQIEASKWLPIDQAAHQTHVEVQLRVHQDSQDWHSESGSHHTTTTQPTPTIWIRLYSTEKEQATEPEELFGFAPYTWEKYVTFRGKGLEIDSPHWDDLDLLLTDIEQHFAPATATSTAI